MSKIHTPKIFKTIWAEAYKHSSEILTGLGITGMITTTVLAVRATPKALILIDERRKKEQIDELKPTEIIEVTWKCYITSVITGMISITCIIYANSVNFRRNTALAAAYSLSESALKEYQEKVVETIGEKKEQEIRDAVAKDKVNKDPVVNKEVYITGKGETLCYETITSRYFKCDIEKLRKVENKLNKRLLSEMYISLNDFFYEIGLRYTDMGDSLGWNISDGLIELIFSSQLAEDDTPCLVIGYRRLPIYDYQYSSF